MVKRGPSVRPQASEGERASTILQDWMFRSRRPAFALWMTPARSVREVKVASEPEALLAVLKNPPTTSSELDWKPGRCHNGFLAFSPRQSYLWFVLKRGTVEGHAGAGSAIAKHARPTGRSALCRPHWLARREREEMWFKLTKTAVLRER